MKKLILTLLLAIVCVPAWASPWDAPNSFEIVKESSWDYRTARTLTEEGKAPAYTTAFFDKTLTRYEIASVVKNILESVPAKDQTEDMARLKKEYTRELEAQGYREKEKKEERKPILEISGDTRVRYKNDSGSDARARVNTTWRIGKTDITAEGSAEKDI